MTFVPKIQHTLLKDKNMQLQKETHRKDKSYLFIQVLFFPRLWIRILLQQSLAETYHYPRNKHFVINSANEFR
ncbi:hypothetical protein HNY73_014204 [Argiope bruennichi]|uniref:Uncharacterized protein n=1 Tax=Argiope bruennichi TaxID=94029 RepID=A0A8T0EN94_ARGBR|nr:hypothetical protein HNY73_014204 [Argiope bruennichi]